MTKPIIASRNFAKRLIPAEEHRTEFLNKNKNWTLGRIDSKIKQTGRDNTKGGRGNWKLELELKVEIIVRQILKKLRLKVR